MNGGGGNLGNLVWSSYSGGQGGDELECVEVDESGVPYACGYATGTYFPIEVGYTVMPAFNGMGAGFWSAVVMKVSPSDKVALWATYYGGDWQTKAHKLAIDRTPETVVGHIFVTGSTYASNFEPHRNPLTVFAAAFIEDYLGGKTRTWIGAFDKNTGIRDWGTTHGETGAATWGEHGLAIDVDETGRLVVAGQIETEGAVDNITPTFPLVTPTGAWSRTVGGAFFIVFTEDYDIEWATTFGEYDNGNSQTKITDLRLERSSEPPYRSFWFAGASREGTSPPLDVVPMGNAYYQANSASNEGCTAMFGRVDLFNRDILYCTRWGDWNAEAYGLELTDKALWVVGWTSDNQLTAAQCPDPGGPGVHHSQTIAGVDAGQGSDGFILRLEDPDYNLAYGTLIGGSRDDILLDVTSHETDGRVYITGETRSPSGFSTDLNANYYFQEQYDYWNRRDALILGIADQSTPYMTWRTAFAGEQSDRGWGMARSETELYLVGSTASFENEGFPLMDFDTNNDLDFFQDFNLGGETSNTFVPFYQFCASMNHSYGGFGWPEVLTTPHDGFIACFGINDIVGVNEPTPGRSNVLQAQSLLDEGQWLLRWPDQSNWRLEVFDATGRRVQVVLVQSNATILNLGAFAVGVYSVRATVGTTVAAAKLVRQ